MKKLFISLLLVTSNTWATECKTTTVSIERNGKIESESATVCKEGSPIERKIYVGDIILENEVGKSKVSEYFIYRNTKCRMFTEHTAKNKELRIYHGVICQINNKEDWLVIDKW